MPPGMMSGWLVGTDGARAAKMRVKSNSEINRVGCVMATKTVAFYAYKVTLIGI